MSLHELASHIQSQGRGEDKMLVHMTPGEVGGLQALAKAHGGSLTTNPETGLPEAGFLSSILPAVAGIGLSMIPGVGPLMAAGIVGGGTALATGNLGKGLMAGLGAYGGAGLGAGLAGMGAAEAAAPAIAAQPAASYAGANLVNTANPSFMGNLSNMGSGLGQLGTAQGWTNLGTAMADKAPYAKLALGVSALDAMKGDPMKAQPQTSMIRPYKYAYNPTGADKTPVDPYGTEKTYFNPVFTAQPMYKAPGPEYAVGGPIETMSAMNAVGENLGYPQSQMQPDIYSNPSTQRPQAMNMIAPSADVNVDPYTGEEKFAAGGLGGYSDGGRLLKGPGDGVSDSIPAVIGNRQPARLADGEFVVPARIVSELGNGSTEAGARKLYAMMDRVQKARRGTVGKEKVAVNSRADKHLPA